MTNQPATSNVQPANPDEDIVIFANQCGFIWSVYLHGAALFQNSAEDDKRRKSVTAPVFFGDLNRMFNEYVILHDASSSSSWVSRRVYIRAISPL